MTIPWLEFPGMKQTHMPDGLANDCRLLLSGNMPAVGAPPKMVAPATDDIRGAIRSIRHDVTHGSVAPVKRSRSIPITRAAHPTACTNSSATSGNGLLRSIRAAPRRKTYRFISNSRWRKFVAARSTLNLNGRQPASFARDSRFCIGDSTSAFDAACQSQHSHHLPIHRHSCSCCSTCSQAPAWEHTFRKLCFPRSI